MVAGEEVMVTMRLLLISSSNVHGYGYLDHAFYGYNALVAAGFLPERRVSCPMDGAYRPQDVQRSRANGRMLGQVRDLIIVRKPIH